MRKSSLDTFRNAKLALTMSGFIALTSLGVGKDGCSNKHFDTCTDAVKYKVGALLKSVQKKDGKDKLDNINEFAYQQKWQEQIDMILKKYDKRYHDQIFCDINKTMPNFEDLKGLSDQEIDALLRSINLETIAERAYNKQIHVDKDGTINFQTKEDEQKLSLADLTNEDEVYFQISEKTAEARTEAGEPDTFDLMGLDEYYKPFKVKRLKEDQDCTYRGKTKKWPAGTFVYLPTEDGICYKVPVFNGDKIISKEDKFQAPQLIKYKQADQGFEKQLKSLLPDMNINNARAIYHENYNNYENLLLDEYKDLLDEYGIRIQEDFAYYLKWVKENNMEVNDESMKKYFEMRLKQLQSIPKEKREIPESKRFKTYEKILTKEYKELLGKNGISFQEDYQRYLQWLNGRLVTEETLREYFEKDLKNKESDQTASQPKISETISKGEENIKGNQENADDKQLAYEDEHSSEIIAEKFNDAFSLVRLQGRFAGYYTYNRLTGKYSAKLQASVNKDRERLMITSVKAVFLSNEKIPADIDPILNKYLDSTLVDRLNDFTTYNQKSDKQLRAALKETVEAYSQIKGTNTNLDNINIQYNEDGSINSITSQGKPLNLDVFIADPNFLRNISDPITLNLGGENFSFSFSKYIYQYKHLETKRQNQGIPQNLYVLDLKAGKMLTYRNPLYFMEEDGGGIYSDIAKKIIGSGSINERQRRIGLFVQENFHYFSENSEINKLGIMSAVDQGGDCDDGTTFYLDLTYASDMSRQTGAVMYPDHVCPMIQGQHGKTTYQPLGRGMWTPFEMATKKGETFNPGVTNSTKEPIVYFFSPSDYQAAPGYSIIEKTEESALNQSSVKKLRDKIKEIELWAEITFKRDDLSDESATSEIADKSREYMQELQNSEIEIVKNSDNKISDSILQDFEKGLQLLSDLSKKIINKIESQDVKEKEAQATDLVNEIKQNPEKMAVLEEKNKEFQTIMKRFAENAEFVLPKVVEKYRAFITASAGATKERKCTLATNYYNEIATILRNANFIDDAYLMQDIYTEHFQLIETEQMKIKAKKTGKKLWSDLYGDVENLINNGVFKYTNALINECN